MANKTIVFLLFIFSFLGLKANFTDSVRYYLKNSKPVLIGGGSSRNTIIGSNITSVTGISTGYDFGGKIKLYAGIYWLGKRMEERRKINAFTPQEKLVDEFSRFWYLGVSGSYVFYKKNKWTLDIPLRIGLGSASVKQYEVPPLETFIKKSNSAIVPLESGISALYKLTWWIGFSGGLGSRIVLGKNNAQKYSGTYYNLGVTVFLEDIYAHILKDMKEHPAKSKRIKL